LQKLASAIIGKNDKTDLRSWLSKLIARTFCRTFLEGKIGKDCVRGEYVLTDMPLLDKEILDNGLDFLNVFSKCV
jgi:hypothetical protein